MERIREIEAKAKLGIELTAQERALLVLYGGNAK